MEIKPYKYKHTYNCLLENKRAVSVFQYDMHSDWAGGKDKRNITEVKKRLSIAMTGIKVKNVYHLRGKKIK